MYFRAVSDFILFFGLSWGAAEDEDEVIVGGDAGGEFGGGFGFDAVSGFECLFGPWFVVGEVVEGIFVGIFAFGGVVDCNIGVAVVFEGLLLGAGEAGSLGTV